MRVLVARLDSDGDVLLAGPAIRAVAAGCRGEPTEVTLLCGPAGAQAGRLLPGVDDLIVWHCPWIAADPAPMSKMDIEGIVARLTGFDAALILTSAHQSSLPLALLLRLAGVGTRAKDCPVAGRPCLASVTPTDVVDALRSISTTGQATCVSP